VFSENPPRGLVDVYAAVIPTSPFRRAVHVD